MLTPTGMTAVKESPVAAEEVPAAAAAPDVPPVVGAEKSLICHSPEPFCSRRGVLLRACGNPALPQRVGLRLRGDDDIPLKVTPYQPVETDLWKVGRSSGR